MSVVLYRPIFDMSGLTRNKGTLTILYTLKNKHIRLYSKKKWPYAPIFGIRLFLIRQLLRGKWLQGPCTLIFEVRLLMGCAYLWVYTVYIHLPSPAMCNLVTVLDQVSDPQFAVFATCRSVARSRLLSGSWAMQSTETLTIPTKDLSSERDRREEDTLMDYIKGWKKKERKSHSNVCFLLSLLPISASITPLHLGKLRT